MRHLSSLLAAAAIAAAPALASAQAATAGHQGFTFSVGIASGSAALSCNGCSTSRQSGFSGYINGGMAYQPNIVIGGELNGWSHSQSGEDDQMLMLLVTGQFYPTADQNLFLKAGLGYGQTQLKDTQNNNTLKAGGLGYEVGVGYDWHLGQSFALTPFANYLGHSQGTATANGSSTSLKLGGNYWQLGAALAWF